MLVAALVMGFVSSLHCVGMCGPLAMLISGKNRNAILLNRLVYNSGRIVTYGVLGLIAGFFGELVTLKGWQQVLSIAVGVSILAMLLFPSIERLLTPNVGGLIYRMRTGVTSMIARPKLVTAFTTGLLNGLLPCGMVYMALALAAVQNGFLPGFGFMIFFGFGTIPALLVTAYSAQWVRSLSPSWKKVQVGFFIILAVLMIGRGLMSGDHALHLFGSSGVTECN